VWESEPKSTYQPFHSLLCRLKQQATADKNQKPLQDAIQVLVLLSCPLLPLFRLGLLAEQAVRILDEAVIQRTQLFKAFVAYLVDCIEVLCNRDLGIEEERLRVRCALGFKVELMGRIGGYHSQLLLKRGHGAGSTELVQFHRGYIRFFSPVKRNVGIFSHLMCFLENFQILPRRTARARSYLPARWPIAAHSTLCSRKFLAVKSFIKL
jgi:hypothetical protein